MSRRSSANCSESLSGARPSPASSPSPERARRTAFDTAQGGYYTDASTFAFELSAPANSASQAGLLAETVDPTTESIRWIVRAPDGSDRRIEAIVPAKGASLALRETMMGCGPVPPLEESRVGAWRGRNPAASGLFDDRAIQWRMKGLLGSGYDAVRERLATAQPAAVTDHVLYVLAPAKDERVPSDSRWQNWYSR